MPQLHPDSHVPGRFPTTQWSRIVTAAGRDGSEAREALSSLCQAYWYPIYVYVRRRGHTPDQAEDLTQEFFAYVLERDLIASADPTRGRFRAFLRTVCVRRLADQHDRQSARKRGGGQSLLPIHSLDAERRYTLESVHEETPERIFDRVWAMTLLDRVVEHLRREYEDAERGDKFEELIGVLTRDPGAEPYAEIANRLGMTEGNVRVAVHRLRRRYGLLLCEEIASTLDDPAQIDDEIRTLFAALGS